MKYKREQIQKIVAKMLQSWKEAHCVELLVDDLKASNEICSEIMIELDKEANLDKEVEMMLSKYEAKFRSGELDRRKMFQMFKAQMAKEKKIVL